MTRPDTTDITDPLAEYLAILFDYLSRVLSAADGGNPHYLHEKSGQLTRAAHRVHNLLSAEPYPDDPTECRQLDERQRFDPTRLRALLAERGRHHRVGRALYPLGGDTNAAAAAHALERAALNLRFDGPDDAGLTPTQADAVARWLRGQAPKQVTPDA